ncbi:hypothetical protein [Pseudooceanicola sp.]|uniref:hypothetical protein n=1 Tax=Pseudooceanicola sp. TaxID=1914328 RepID=UPI00261F4CCD|nr:hypothetical protein [Pseudooceanicola sp.]MDF1855750.1 hypothetical protein [Pseudooceanicola sp.]
MSGAWNRRIDPAVKSRPPFPSADHIGGGMKNQCQYGQNNQRGANQVDLRAAVRRNLAWMEARSLIREVTEHGWYRLCRVQN